MELVITCKIQYTDKDIDDIMCTALEGGITYWCDSAEVVGDYLGKYASDQISRGGTLKLYDSESDECYELTKEKFLAGLQQFIRERGFGRDAGNGHTSSVITDGKLDTSCIDAEDADYIVQCALFGEVVYG